MVILDNSNEYKKILSHRRYCNKWGKEFCLDCFGGGLNLFVEKLIIKEKMIIKRKDVIMIINEYWDRYNTDINAYIGKLIKEIKK